MERKLSKPGVGRPAAEPEPDTSRPPFDPAKFAREYEADPPSRRPTPHAGTAYEALRDSCRPMKAARAITEVLPQLHPDHVVEVAMADEEVTSIGLVGASGALVAAMNGARSVRMVATVTQIDLPTALLRTAFLIERGIVRIVR